MYCRPLKAFEEHPALIKGKRSCTTLLHVQCRLRGGRAVWRPALQAMRSTRKLREGRGYAPAPVADSTRREASCSRSQRQCSRKKGVALSSCRAAGVRGPRQFLSSVLFVDLNTAMQPPPFSVTAPKLQIVAARPAGT